ncbi:hypothetical protein B0T11DRAFT_242654 [Plectosphaerella cucumerina]|uniref:Uncharacterized protein n=1 Tax=Plectosphaerella cucumerina TaxID=40658 RepID=A0A8K0X4A5_9PEZI|nr:hypothetical protein B0T11DRAFT_242654 [Plectosphaerella cucumerina]
MLCPSSTLHEAHEIRQVDKLARYLFLCKDFLRLARKPQYQRLFRKMDAIALEAYSGEVPSACYLCDLLITKQNRYRISHAHRRLYEKWTIPNVGWMSEDQAAVFATVIQDMMQEVTAAIRRQQTGGRAWTAYPLESRAFLPLSSGSTASESTVQAVSSRASSRGTVRDLQRGQQSSVCTTVSLLPFRKAIHAGTGPIEIQIDQLHLSLDFAPDSSGYLSIDRRCDSPGSTSKRTPTVEALGIPTDLAMKVECDQGTNEARVRIQNGPQLCVEISFRWEGETPGCRPCGPGG